MYLVGWKAIAKWIGGVSERTIQRWHYERVRLPIMKSSGKKNGSIVVTIPIIHEWLKLLGVKK